MRCTITPKWRPQLPSFTVEGVQRGGRVPSSAVAKRLTVMATVCHLYTPKNGPIQTGALGQFVEFGAAGPFHATGAAETHPHAQRRGGSFRAG